MKVKAFILVYSISIILVQGVTAAGNRVTISACDWEPYTGNQLTNKGFLSEITTEALKSSGYEPSIVIMPWKRALVKTKEGDFDALIGASYTKERTPYFAYPEYFWENSMVFFTRKGKTVQYADLNDLCPDRLGLLRGSFYVEKLSSVPCLNQDLAKDTLTNIKKLVHGRLDLILDSRDSINFTVNHYIPDKADAIEPILPPYETDKIYTVFSKKKTGFEVLVRQFDDGIRKIIENGTYDRILVKHGMKP